MIREPNLNCDHCYHLKAKHNLKPRCETSLGCPIEDLASDHTITEACQKFNLAKTLFNTSELPESQERIFKELGLFDDEYLWLQLECTYAEARSIRAKRENDRRANTRKR